MKPKSLLDPAFEYVPAVSTDIRKTFARARKEQAREAAKAGNVTPIKKRAGAK